MSIFDHLVPNIAGELVSIPPGKAAYLLVNVASEWGYTASNYQEMAELYSKHSSKGLEILAFPCNDFGGQEPNGNSEISDFAQSRGATFPVYGKIKILPGAGQSTLYDFLMGFTGNGMKSGVCKWNFEKFLVGPDGTPVSRYSSRVSPMKIEADILKLLE